MARALTVLSVASPFAPVGPDAVGGAEQIASSLDRALIERGHRSIVIAQRGSRVRGALVPMPVFDPLHGREAAHAAWRAAIARAIASDRPDAVHLHGLDAHFYAPERRAVWTLHLPLDNDDQIAAIINYERTSWGNNGVKVSSDDVKKIRNQENK